MDEKISSDILILEDITQTEMYPQLSSAKIAELWEKYIIFQTTTL